MNLNQVTLPVIDMLEPPPLYTNTPPPPTADPPPHARFESQEGESTFSLTLNTLRMVNPTVIYFEHEQLDELVSVLQAKGFIFQQEPADMSYLWREAILNDPSGNKIILYWAGENRRRPPWRVELSEA